MGQGNDAQGVLKEGAIMGPNVMPEQGKVKLCGVQGCCPEVDFTNPEQVVLRDDFGGSVQLTRDQWSDLKTKFAVDQTPS